MKKLVCIIVCIFVFSLPCSAVDIDTGDISSTVPGEVEELIPGGYPEGGFSGDDIGAGLFFKMIARAVSSAAPKAISSLMTLLGLILISSVLGAVRSSVSSNSVGAAMDFLSAACISSAVLGVTGGIFEMAETFITSLGAFMSAALPPLVLLCAMGGRTAFAASSSAVVSTALAVLDSLCSSAVLPLIKMCFCISISSAVCSGVDLGGISMLIKKIIGYVFSIGGIGLSVILMFQNVITKSADSAVIKGLKFTVGATVPIVGGAINEAMTTICGSVGVLRSTLGISGAVVICAIMIIPIAELSLNKLALDISAAVAGMLMLKKEQSLLSQIGSVIGFLIAICAFTGAFFIIAVAVMASAEVT